MKRFTILAAFYAVAMTGCSGRVSHERSEPSGSSMTNVEIAPLDSPPPPLEASPDPQSPILDLNGTVNAVHFGNVAEHQHHLHIHEAQKQSNVGVDVRVLVDVTDQRERRRQLVEQRINELRSRTIGSKGETDDAEH